MVGSGSTLFILNIMIFTLNIIIVALNIMILYLKVAEKRNINLTLRLLLASLVVECSFSYWYLDLVAVVLSYRGVSNVGTDIQKQLKNFSPSSSN